MTKALEPIIPENYIAIERQSPFSKLLGIFYVPAEQTKDDSVVRIGMVLEERHGGAHGRGHGGIAMSFLDEAMGRAASWSTGKLCVTSSFTSNFCSSSKANTFIYAEARVRKRGATVVFIDGDLYDQTGKLISTATGTWSITKENVPS